MYRYLTPATKQHNQINEFFIQTLKQKQIREAILRNRQGWAMKICGYNIILTEIQRQITHYINQRGVMQAIEKHRDSVMNILKSADFDSLPKQFHQAIMVLLDIHDFKLMNSKNVAERIIYLYESCKGNFQKYLAQKKFNHVHGELKQYVWNVFKKFHEIAGVRKPPFNKNQFGNMSSEMNMNMLNMFLNVPNLQSIQEIQFFQRKMYDICKKSMPQVLNTLSMGASKPAPPMFRQNYMGMNYDQNHEFDFAQNYPYYQNNRMKNVVGNRMEAPDMKNMSSFRNYYREDGSNEDRNSQRPIFSQDYIKSPQETQKQKFFSQQNIHYDSELQQSRNKFPNEGFTFYDVRSPKQSPDLPKIPKFLNSPPDYIHSYENQEYYVKPRKIVKKDFQQRVLQNAIIKKPISIVKVPTLSCMCGESEAQKCDCCIVSKMDLFHESEALIQFAYIQQEGKSLQIKLNQSQRQKISQNPEEYDLQLRSIKPESINKQIEWPQNLKISINGQQMFDFSLSTKRKRNKKQAQPSFLLSKELDSSQLEGKPLVITIQYNNEDKKNKEKYLIAAFFVRKLSIQKLYEKIKKNIGVMDIARFFESGAKEENSGEAQKITIKPTDPLTKEIMQDPVRGANCQHPECFDLRAYLRSQKQSDVRDWKCPICKKSISEFVLDKQIKEVLKDVKMMISQPEQIIMYKSGGYKLNFKEEEKIPYKTYELKQQIDSPQKAAQIPNKPS